MKTDRIPLTWTCPLCGAPDSSIEYTCKVEEFGIVVGRDVEDKTELELRKRGSCGDGMTYKCRSCGGDLADNPDTMHVIVDIMERLRERSMADNLMPEHTSFPLPPCDVDDGPQWLCPGCHGMQNVVELETTTTKRLVAGAVTVNAIATGSAEANVGCSSRTYACRRCGMVVAERPEDMARLIDVMAKSHER